MLQDSIQMHNGFMVPLILDYEDGGDFLPKRRLTYRLHCDISQQVVTFVTTTVRKSNPTRLDSVE
jgi:hypothetical protein